MIEARGFVTSDSGFLQDHHINFTCFGGFQQFPAPELEGRHVELPNEQGRDDSVCFPTMPSRLLRPRVRFHTFFCQVTLPGSWPVLRRGPWLRLYTFFCQVTLPGSRPVLSSGLFGRRRPLADASSSAGLLKPQLGHLCRCVQLTWERGRLVGVALVFSPFLSLFCRPTLHLSRPFVGASDSVLDHFSSSFVELLHLLPCQATGFGEGLFVRASKAQPPVGLFPTPLFRLTCLLSELSCCAFGQALTAKPSFLNAGKEPEGRGVCKVMSLLVLKLFSPQEGFFGGLTPRLELCRVLLPLLLHFVRTRASNLGEAGVVHNPHVSLLLTQGLVVSSPSKGLLADGTAPGDSGNPVLPVPRLLNERKRLVS